MSFQRRGQAALSIIQSAQVPPVEWLVYSFLSCFNLSNDSVLIACSMRQASFSAVFGSTPASISIAEKNWCFSSVISATERLASVKIRKRRSSIRRNPFARREATAWHHLASIPPDAVLHPQTVPPPFSSEGVGSLPDNLPLTHALPIPSLLVHPATAMVLSQVQTFFSWEGYCLNSIKQKNSVSKKYFRPAVRILKLSKSFKNPVD